MSPQKSRPEVTSNGTANKQHNDTQSVQRSSDLPHARANAGPPVRGRSLWAITVLVCPVCGGLHQHRGGDVTMLLRGRLVRTCPTSGERYRLSPVRRWREARRG